MTLNELVATISGFADWQHSDKIKLFAWHLHTYLGCSRFFVADIRNCYDSLSLDQPRNVSSLLKALEKKRPRQILYDRQGYTLEKRLRDEFDGKYGQRITTVQIHKLLLDLPSKVPNVNQRDFLNEAIICLRNGAPRAAIVMSWNLAFDHLCDFILKAHLGQFNAQWPIRFPKSNAKIIVHRDEFNELKESEVLEICRSANITTANTHKILKEKLDRRNIAAHPNSIVFTPLQAEEYISDIVNNIILKLI